MLDRSDVHQDPLVTVELTQNDGTWQATVADLPVGPVLTGDTDSLSIGLEPITTPDPIAFPIIRSITRPLEIVQGADAVVEIALQGTAGEDLNVELITGVGGGSFSPRVAIATVSRGGTTSVQSTYSAPAEMDREPLSG